MGSGSWTAKDWSSYTASRYLDSSSPQAFKDFVNSGTKSDSMKEMEKWDEALVASFGKRRFIKIEATDKDIYKKERN